MDLWHVDLNISEQKFKGEGLNTIKIALPKNYYAFSFDLKAVYHYVDIFSNHHKYLAFSWNFGTGYVRHFQFTVLPLVLSSAPFIFTRLLKPLETQWRRQGIPIAIFFDGGIGAGSPLNSAEINSSIVRADLSHCSLEIHKEKFNWEPERKFSWIGYNLDAKTRLSFASCGPLAVEISYKS